MKQQGLTLYELILSLSIIAITLVLALPSFDKLIKESRLKTQSLELHQAIELTRSTAVFSGKRAVLRAADNGWHSGWTLFIDQNDDGLLNGDERAIAQQEPLTGVIIRGNYHLQYLVSFIANGEGRSPGSANRGAFTVGKLAICPEQEGDGYQIILSKGGRSRMEELTAADCTQAKQGQL